jgi:ATPase subunit of ABC transporter with duplicated ATPase domains
MLYALHATQNPLVILGLREKDPVPDWISHVAVVGDGSVRVGRKEDMVQPEKAYPVAVPSSRPPPSTDGKILVEMKNVNVVYGDRHVRLSTQKRVIIRYPYPSLPQVLKDISWTIRASQRWHLIGSNGSLPSPLPLTRS